MQVYIRFQLLFISTAFPRAERVYIKANPDPYRVIHQIHNSKHVNSEKTDLHKSFLQEKAEKILNCMFYLSN